MNKQHMDLAFEVLGFLRNTADKHFDYKSEHDQMVERMHTNEMNTKKECLEKIVLLVTPLVSIAAFHLNGKLSDKKMLNETLHQDK